MAEMKTKDGFYDVYDDLRDTVQSIIDDGEKDVDEAIRRAIDDGLIYSRDIVELGLHYGVID
ncbi:hypothetical protein, partial [Sharpea azabuensis]|uniref:hypothetical protein n=1 Tax=Sharpea azabuensis TaxID=322505 RepID=UPI002E815A8A